MCRVVQKAVLISPPRQKVARRQNHTTYGYTAQLVDQKNRTAEPKMIEIRSLDLGEAREI